MTAHLLGLGFALFLENGVALFTRGILKLYKTEGGDIDTKFSRMEVYNLSSKTVIFVRPARPPGASGGCRREQTEDLKKEIIQVDRKFK